MKIILLLIVSISLKANNLYIQTFGEKSSEPLLFLHGGPGFNSYNFEVTTARRLADSGFFMIVYDRRGEGNSVDTSAKYTFEESIRDINFLLDSFNLEKSSLIGHSFGGMLAIKFAEVNPNRIKNIYLVGAPLNLQNSFKNIIAKSRDIYTKNNDKANLNYLNKLAEMDTNSLIYSSNCFMQAMQNGFYSPKSYTDEANKIIKKVILNTATSDPQKQRMMYLAPQKFWENESYTTIDLTENLQKLVKDNVSIIGIYGKDDGLYNNKIVSNIEKVISPNNMHYLDSCSHNVFIDRQSEFVRILIHGLK